MITLCDLRWYVLQTKPKQEARAEANLRTANIETLAPKLRQRDYSHRNALPNRIVPLFPNYLFARFDAAVLLSKIRLTRGIQRVVGFGEYATPIEDGVIELIRSRIDENGLVDQPEMRPGDTVEIVDGPFRSLVGVFERYTCARERVVILLTTIGYQRRVDLESTVVKTVADRQHHEWRI